MEEKEEHRKVFILTGEIPVPDIPEDPLVEEVIREIIDAASPEPEIDENMPLDPNATHLLTDDALLWIFRFFDKVELTTCSLVCKRWNKISKDRTLWKTVNFAPLNTNISDKDFQALAMTKMKCTQKVYLGSLQVSFKMLKSFIVHCRLLNTLVFGRGSVIEEVPEAGRSKVVFPKTLKTLDLRNAMGNFHFLNGLRKHFSYVVNFGVASHSFSDKQLKLFFTRLPALERADFTNCEQMDDRGVATLANNCPNLRSLCLIGCRFVYGTSFSTLIEKCTNLRTLLVRYLKIEDDVFTETYWNRSSLQELDISACPRLTWQGLKGLLVQLRWLEYLNMSYCGEGNAVNDKVLEKMSTLGSNMLRMLDIRWSFHISPTALANFLSNCNRLEYLGIYQSFHVFSEHLAEMIPKLPNLKTLEFGACFPQELSLSKVIPQLIINTTDLETLSIINFQASDQRLASKYLKALVKRCKKIRRINFCDCSQDLIRIGRQVVEKQRRRIEVTIKWECALPPPQDTLDAITSVR